MALAVLEDQWADRRRPSVPPPSAACRSQAQQRPRRAPPAL